ncbi:CHRD domain-containing protein [Streptomyces sp. NPDC005481]|uniref:CHRD domain-containing protein n=1 Tax=Streptomyces sp. NPDC005481 TaxID=3154881 RepID=UPI0033AAAB20
MGPNLTPAGRRTKLVIGGAALAAAAGIAVAAAPGVAAQGVAPESAQEGATVLAAALRGADEVPADGDENGSALEFIRIDGDRVSVAVSWRGIGKPTRLHLHEGAKGTSGGVAVDFTRLLDKGGLHRAAGTVKVEDAALLQRLRSAPGGFYANLHTAAFPGGAVRGQLHQVTTDVDFRHVFANFRASVVEGRQIYECKPAEGGGHAFAQRDVGAVLDRHIAHSFVAPNSGTPQWIAPDGSAVTGAVLSRTPNGAGNIPELDLKATASGKPRGLLAGTAEILRLNTVGGVAPAGPCTPGATVGVPYRADYVFVQR